MAKTSGGVRGKYATQIKGARSLFQQERQKAYKELDSLLRGMKSLTDIEYKALSRNVAYLESHPVFGTEKALENYINRNKRLMRTGEYKEGLMNISSGLGGEVTRSMGKDAAYRDLLPRMKDLLRKHRR